MAAASAATSNEADMMSQRLRLLALGGIIYVVVAYGGAYIIAIMQRQLAVVSCQQAAQADKRDGGECRELAMKPITIEDGG